jgi:glycosyltransferase involved in cell wall biosynthesis
VNIIITSIAGDPLQVSTWSGTPSRLAEAFESLGHQVTGIHTIPTSVVRIGAALVHFSKGFKSEFRRTALHRGFALSMIKGSRAYPDADVVIHTGTHDAPVHHTCRKALHVCYVDSTWASWSTGDARARALPPRLMRRIDHFERESLQSFDHIFPIGQHVVEELTSYYDIDPARITPVGTGMGGVRPFQGVKNYDSKKILCIAKERHRDKGVHLLVEAFTKLRDFHPDAQLTIIGGQSVADELTAQPGLTLTGRVSNEELANHLQEACLYAMPAANEPWGLVFLEALAQKVPLLGLRQNAFPEITAEGQFGFMIDDPSSEAIAQKMATALEAPHILEQMGTAGQLHTMEYYTWRKTSERILAKLPRI